MMAIASIVADAAANQRVELVELSLRVFVFLHRTLSHQVCGIVKQGHLSVCSGLSEHGNLLSNMYASYIIIN